MSLSLSPLSEVADSVMRIVIRVIDTDAVITGAVAQDNGLHTNARAHTGLRMRAVLSVPQTNLCKHCIGEMREVGFKKQTKLQIKSRQTKSRQTRKHVLKKCARND